MNGNQEENKETQAKPYVIANPVENNSDNASVVSNTTVNNSVSSENVTVSAPAAMPTNNTNTPVVNAPAKPTVRYNPVTGEEMNLSKEIENDKNKENSDPGSVDNTEKLKTIEVDYQPTSTANTVMLVLFFIFLIIFVVFLPNIQSLIAEYKAGGKKEEKEIVNGTLICELADSTINLDTKYERRFTFTDKKLKSAKFTTTIRGNESLDSEELTSLNNKCKQVKDNVEDLSGTNVSCTYENGKITEVESFDYANYKQDEVIAAYAEAGADLPEFTLDQNIDDVKTLMNRSGFSCKVIDADAK